ncbi:MAG: PD-(D/E)XK nuclease family protein, partial [Bacteroidales bacterium]|nr:PD-(D/E)XK nuclease family protein [Bacteroidales bacterium]
LWKLVYNTLEQNPSQAQRLKIKVTVHTPKVLIPKLIVEVLEKLETNYIDYSNPKLRTDNRNIIAVKEQYEAWQLAALQNPQTDTLVVCEDSARLNNTLKGLRGEAFDIENSQCIHPTDDITNQLDPPHKIVWFDCAGETGAIYKFGFLTHAEIAELQTLGLKLPTHEELSKARQLWIISLLNRAESVDFIVPKYKNGELLSENAMVTELKHNGMKPQPPKGFVLTNEADVISFFPTDYIKLNSNHIRTLDKGNDSPSSMETLFQRPFDFFMEKMLDLKAPEDDCDDNLSNVKGKVAHKVVELMLQNHKGDRDGFMGEFNNYDSLLDAALNAAGELLNAPENKNELAIFKQELNESLKTLCNLIEKLELVPMECEKELSTKFDFVNKPHGYIDMVLKDKDGKWVIFDFKYSKKDTYKKYLENNQSLQLTYYTHALPKTAGGEVAWCGYYLFPKQTLYTQNDSLKGIDNVEVVTPVTGAPTESEFWEMVKSTYEARMKEIDDGSIEEGEGFDIKKLRISSVEKTIEIEGDYIHKDKKSTDFCKYPSEDALIRKPTSHTILKNHLK